MAVGFHPQPTAVVHNPIHRFVPRFRAIFPLNFNGFPLVTHRATTADCYVMGGTGVGVEE